MTADPRVLDAGASATPDFICIDTQHGLSLARLDVATFTSLTHYGVPALVRVDSNQETPICRALDMGADGVIVPLVDNADDARKAVAACRYAPEGTRSYGVQTRRIDPIAPDSSPRCWIQIETGKAMANLDEIASVAGVDVLYIGPADLGLALCGTPASDVEAVFDGTHPHAAEMRSAFDQVLRSCQAHGVVAGLHCGSGAAAARAVAEGFQVAAVAADLPAMTSALEAELERARSG